MRIVFADLIRREHRQADGYSRLLQAARVRAAHQRSYFAPALFNLIPVETTLIGSMAVDVHWRLYYNDGWLTAHSVEENATLLIDDVSHLLRDHDARRKAAGFNDHRRWNTAGDCEINDDLHAEGLPLPGNPPLPDAFGLPNGSNAESYYAALPAPPKSHRRDPSDDVRQQWQDCGTGAHGQRRFWELPPDSETDGGVPSVDRMKAELVQREVARCDAAVHDVRRAFTGAPIQLYGGGGTDLRVGLQAFVEKTRPAIDVLFVVSDCRTPWPDEAPPFPVVTIRVGDGTPAPWGH